MDHRDCESPLRKSGVEVARLGGGSRLRKLFEKRRPFSSQYLQHDFLAQIGEFAVLRVGQCRKTQCFRGWKGLFRRLARCVCQAEEEDYNSTARAPNRIKGL